MLKGLSCSNLKSENDVYDMHRLCQRTGKPTSHSFMSPFMAALLRLVNMQLPICRISNQYFSSGSFCREHANGLRFQWVKGINCIPKLTARHLVQTLGKCKSEHILSVTYVTKSLLSSIHNAFVNKFLLVINLFLTSVLSESWKDVDFITRG